MCPAQIDKEQQTLTVSDPFHFGCHDNLPCFTQCCRDVNIYLTPYDVLRLRRRLKIGSGEFLAKYTRHFLARGANIPVVQFAMNPDTLYCQLVTDDGCSVYDDRPWACRMYPLDLTSVAGEYRTIVGKERCFGLREPATTTVEAWLAGQGVEPYVLMEAAFQSVMPTGFKPGDSLSGDLGKLLFLAYDLDRFEAIINDPRLQRFYEIDEEVLGRAREDDEALLRLAFRYIRAQMDELYQSV